MTLLLTAAAAFAADTVLYVVRHAEKATTSDDPPLTDAGTARAAALAKVLADVPLAGVHSTDTLRTRSTAAPAAAAKNLPVELYDAKKPADLLAEVRKEGGAHLVVGHSNTVAPLVAAAGGVPGPDPADAQFDLLFVVVLPDEGPATALRLRYGP